MTARDNACMKELSRLIASGLTPEEAIEDAIRLNEKRADICTRMGQHALASVAWNRVDWYRQRRKDG